MLDSKESLEFYLKNPPYALNQKDAYQFYLKSFAVLNQS